MPLWMIARSRIATLALATAATTLFLLLTALRNGRAQDGTGWLLAWSDEFEGPANSPVDPGKWSYDLGDGSPRNPGWGNHEKQIYTNSLDNAFLDGQGHLVLRALSRDGIYTSARIKTQGKFEFQYGRVMARIRTSYAKGIWQAFWMLGASYRTTAWPVCGEIDIMEAFGSLRHDASTIQGTIHGPGYGDVGITRPFSLTGERLADGFHVFSIDWAPNSIDFLVDGHAYFKTTPAKLPPDGSWVFNQPFFLVLNVAVGGYPAPVGYPDETTKFPQEMVVDYIRVYKHLESE